MAREHALEYIQGSHAPQRRLVYVPAANFESCHFPNRLSLNALEFALVPTSRLTIVCL